MNEHKIEGCSTQDCNTLSLHIAQLFCPQQHTLFARARVGDVQLAHKVGHLDFNNLRWRTHHIPPPL
jgi:hypothetical protein